VSNAFFNKNHATITRRIRKELPNKIAIMFPIELIVNNKKHFQFL